jgi:hypothetical protein
MNIYDWVAKNKKKMCRRTQFFVCDYLSGFGKHYHEGTKKAGIEEEGDVER